MRRSLAWLALFAALIVLVLLVRPQLLYPLMPSGHAVEVAYDEEHLVISGTYPEFGRPNVDAHIRSLVLDGVVQPALEALTVHGHAPGVVDTLTIGYTVPYRTLRYAGVLIRVTVDGHDFDGEYVIVRTYDLFKDRLVGLDEIAIPTRSPSEAAVEAILAELEGREDVSLILLSRLEPRRDMFENLLVRSDGLEFFFSPGQIAPWERGVMTVVVPWDEAIDLQKP